MNNINIPEFLQQEPPTLTKPEDRHLEKLRELVSGMDAEDAIDICNLLADKYPLIMLEALEIKMDELIGITKSARDILNKLKEV